jgi:proteasome lid subunit RPN8/RPN11
MSSSNQGITLVKEIWPVTNVETQNKNRFFNMSVADIHNVVKACREKFLDVIGFYHSHPFGIASPSQQDIEMATAWPGYYHLIIAPQRDQSQELNAFITAKPVWKKTKII